MSSLIWILLLCGASLATAQYGGDEQPPPQKACNLACIRNTRCVIVNGKAKCIPINESHNNGQPPQENPCNLADCIPNTRCIVVKGEAKCVPLSENGENDCETESESPTCATILCIPPTTCVIRPKNPNCQDDCPAEAACVAPAGGEQPVTVAKTSAASNSCPPNEQYNRCGSACEPSCKNPKPEVCTLQCVVGCQCKPGFFRNSKKVCISNCYGENGEGCGENEESKTCGTACEPTCADPKPVCTEQCVVNVCQCKEGFIRDASNKCIPVDSCPKDRIKSCSEMNCPKGTTCELGRVICPFVPPCFTRPTQCVPNGLSSNNKLLSPSIGGSEPSITCANVRCRDGTVCKLVDVVCVKAPCPPIPQCVANEPYNPCAATTCPVGSECRVKQVQCVRAPCEPIGECYTAPQKTQPTTCGKFETYKDCASNCEPSCANKAPICILSCAPPRCQCNNGFFRNASGNCVTEAECDAPQVCDKNEHFSNCTSPCEPKCGEKQRMCKAACEPPGCQCLAGFYRNNNNKCVSIEECTSNTALICGMNEEHTQCSGCEQNCSANTTMCSKNCGSPKCQCLAGYFRNSSGSCVEEKHCNTKCGKNEVYSECSPRCHKSCRGRTECFSDNSTAVCVQGCVCKEGYRRNGNGLCVKPKYCYQAPGCRIGEKWSSCSTCEQKCTEKSHDCHVCYSGCACDQGYARDHNGECIPTEDCVYA